MNCLQFRHRLMADPDDRSEAFLHHAEHCPRCQEEYRRSQKMERDLHQALGMSPPQGLRERIIMQGRFRSAQQTRRRYAQLGAIAAVLLLCAGLVFQFSGMTEPGLEHQVIDHIAHEANLIQGPASHWVDEARVNALLQSLGGHIDGKIGRVRHAGRCHMGKGDGLHLVLQGEQGAVTLFLMPRQAVDSAIPIQAGNLQGLILPHQGGSIAVVGQRDEDTLQIGEQARRAIRWEI